MVIDTLIFLNKSLLIPVSEGALCQMLQPTSEVISEMNASHLANRILFSEEESRIYSSRCFYKNVKKQVRLSGKTVALSSPILYG